LPPFIIVVILLLVLKKIKIQPIYATNIYKDRKLILESKKKV